jgi:two-component system response regulator FixJ
MADHSNFGNVPGEDMPIYKAMLNKDRVVGVLTGDAGLWEVLSSLLKLEGFTPQLFTRHSDLTDNLRRMRPTCLILGLDVDGERPLDVLKTIRGMRNATPVIALVEQGCEIRLVTELMRGGALEVLEVPVDSQLLLHTVREIVKKDIQLISVGGVSRVKVLGYATLTTREREIVERICDGLSNKEIALELDISPRTVEVHRAKAMQKLGSRNTAELVRRIVAS